MIRVLIADAIAQIVGDLEKLAPYGDIVEVCGVAHQASAVLEEAGCVIPTCSSSTSGSRRARQPSSPSGSAEGITGDPRAPDDRPRKRPAGTVLDGPAVSESGGRSGAPRRPFVSPPATVPPGQGRLGDASEPEVKISLEPRSRDVRAPLGPRDRDRRVLRQGRYGTSLVATNLAVTLAEAGSPGARHWSTSTSSSAMPRGSST